MPIAEDFLGVLGGIYSKLFEIMRNTIQTGQRYQYIRYSAAHTTLETLY